jgi:hypothetical protein
MAQRSSASGKSQKGAPRSSRHAVLPVGRPLQALLIGVEKKIGLFSAEGSFAADSRFNHPVILPGTEPAPAEMRALFAGELEALARLGRDPGTCHTREFPPFRVCCRSYFHYDGFRALLYLEREGRFLAAWMEQEVHQPDSPRTLLSAVDGARIEALLGEVLADLA